MKHCTNCNHLYVAKVFRTWAPHVNDNSMSGDDNKSRAVIRRCIDLYFTTIGSHRWMGEEITNAKPYVPGSQLVSARGANFFFRVLYVDRACIEDLFWNLTFGQLNRICDWICHHFFSIAIFLEIFECNINVNLLYTYFYWRTFLIADKYNIYINFTCGPFYPKGSWVTHAREFYFSWQY